MTSSWRRSGRWCVPSSNGHGGYREGNPTYKLTPKDREIIRLMLLIREGSWKLESLWNDTAMAKAFNVSRKTIYRMKQDL